MRDDSFTLQGTVFCLKISSSKAEAFENEMNLGRSKTSTADKTLWFASIEFAAKRKIYLGLSYWAFLKSS